jgi:hypothetical protein
MGVERESYDDENPAPASEAFAAVELLESESQNTSKGRSNTSKEVEESVSLTNLISCIPGAQKVNTAGEETSLQEAQKNTHAGQLSVIIDKAHANHDGSPEEADCGEVDAWADGADDDGRGWLEDNVRDEEDEVANIVAVSREFQFHTHAGNVGGAHVGAIHETDTVHCTNSDDETTIDTPHDLLLFLLGEAMVDVLMVLFLGQLSRTIVAELVLLLELTG